MSADRQGPDRAAVRKVVSTVLAGVTH
jgi:hypothetical protein